MCFDPRCISCCASSANHSHSVCEYYKYIGIHRHIVKIFYGRLLFTNRSGGRKVSYFTLIFTTCTNMLLLRTSCSSEVLLFIPFHFCIQINPTLFKEIATNDALRHTNLWLLVQRIITQVNCLGCILALIRTPRFAPQPFLWQTKNWNLMLCIIGEILVQIGQRIGICGKLLIC